MDSRLFIVFLPVVAALGWVFINIGRLALQQFSRTQNN